MESKTLTLKYTISVEDYLNAVKLYGRERRIYYFLLVPVFLLMPFFATDHSFHAYLSVPDLKDFDNFFPFGLFVIVFLVSFYWLLPAKVRRAYRQQRLLHDENTAVITQESLQGSSLHGRSDVEWGYFLKWKGDKRIFLLYESDVMYVMIPTRAFTSDEDIEWFRGLLSERVPKKKRGK